MKSDIELDDEEEEDVVLNDDEEDEEEDNLLEKMGRVDHRPLSKGFRI